MFFVISCFIFLLLSSFILFMYLIKCFAHSLIRSLTPASLRFLHTYRFTVFFHFFLNLIILITQLTSVLLTPLIRLVLIPIQSQVEFKWLHCRSRYPYSLTIFAGNESLATAWPVWIEDVGHHCVLSTRILLYRFGLKKVRHVVQGYSLLVVLRCLRNLRQVLSICLIIVLVDVSELFDESVVWIWVGYFSVGIRSANIFGIRLLH